LAACALCEIASGHLDLAASTLAECRADNQVWDFVVRLAKCKLALARQEYPQALAIADALVATVRQYKLGQYLPEALFLKGQAHVLQGEPALAQTVFEQARLATEPSARAACCGRSHRLWPSLNRIAGLPRPPLAQARACWEGQ
jgi:hypothetical protein